MAVRLVYQYADVLDIFFATIYVYAKLLFGFSQTWQKVNAKLQVMNEEQLLEKVSDLEKNSLTQEQVDLAKKKLERAGGTFSEHRTVETIKKQVSHKLHPNHTAKIFLML